MKILHSGYYLHSRERVNFAFCKALESGVYVFVRRRYAHRFEFITDGGMAGINMDCLIEKIPKIY